MRWAEGREPKMAPLPGRFRYGLVGALLALGAPGGLLALRAFEDGRAPEPGWIVSEIAHEPSLYLYLLMSTAVVFALFGFAVGRQADRFSKLSISDPLTGLLNGRALSERLAAECARASRYSEPLSLLLIDVDGLKDLNDSMGHSAGDVALCAVASAVRRCSRTSDVASRWGGDEFAVVAPSTDAASAEHMAERIRSLAAHAPAEGAAVTVSVGVATWAVGAGNCRPDGLKESADEALYQAKRAGRNCVRALARAAASSKKGLNGGGSVGSV
jgi:diguanylate cyclase (GGDEF)-like protein